MTWKDAHGDSKNDRLWEDMFEQFGELLPDDSEYRVVEAGRGRSNIEMKGMNDEWYPLVRNVGKYQAADIIEAFIVVAQEAGRKALQKHRDRTGCTEDRDWTKRELGQALGLTHIPSSDVD